MELNLHEVLAETPGAALAVAFLWLTVGRALAARVTSLGCKVDSIDAKLEANGIRTVRPGPSTAAVEAVNLAELTQNGSPPTIDPNSKSEVRIEHTEKSESQKD